MLQKTVKELEDHILSVEWDSVDVSILGSEKYQNQLGLMRIMFPTIVEPYSITTLQSNKTTEVWIREKGESWTQIY
jgi:hypothetical protein